MVAGQRIVKEDVIQARVTRKTRKRIEQLAKDKGMSAPDWIRYLIQKEIEAKDAEQAKV